MIEIVIWVSPVDLDDLSKTLSRLQIGKDYLDENQIKINKIIQNLKYAYPFLFFMKKNI